MTDLQYREIALDFARKEQRARTLISELCQQLHRSSHWRFADVHWTECEARGCVERRELVAKTLDPQPTNQGSAA